MHIASTQDRNVFGSPGLRLLQLYMLLHSGKRAYSLGRLAQLFYCSRQTILRMIDQLQRVGSGQIQTWLEGGERFYKAVPQPAPQTISLTIESLQQLVLCRDIVRHLLPESVQEEITASLSLTAAFINNSHDKDAALASHAESVGKGTIDYTPYQGYLDDLQLAMTKNRLCRLQYRSRSVQRPKTYLYAPQRIVAFREALYTRGMVYTTEQARGQGQARTFAVHRISGLTLLPSRFTPQPCDSEADTFGFHYDPPFTVKATFHGAAALYVSERTWSRGQHLQPHRDGSVTLTFTSTSRREVIAWILGFGPDAELLEPPDLREEIAKALSSTLSVYEPKGLALDCINQGTDPLTPTCQRER